jgi:hypothetical protein
MPTTAIESHQNSATDAIVSGYPEGSTWLALEDWARNADLDSNRFCQQFNTGQDESDILSTWAAILAATPSHDASVTTATVDLVHRVVRAKPDRIAERIVAVRVGFQWVIDEALAGDDAPNSRPRQLSARLTMMERGLSA